MSLLKACKSVGYDLSDEKEFDEAKFKEHLDKTYVSRELAATDEEIKKKIAGNIFGGLNAKAKKVFGLSEAEIKDKPFEEILEAGKNKFEAEKKTWEEKSKHTSDERVTKLEKDLEIEREFKTQVQTEFETFKSTVEKEKGELLGQVKSVKLNTKVKEVKSKIPFTDEFVKNPVAVRGFDAIIGDKYRFDLDENEEIVVTDLNGKPVKHPTVSGQRATIEDVFKMEAEANKFLKKNNAPDNNTRKSWLPTGDGGETVNTTKVHKNAVKREQSYNG